MPALDRHGKRGLSAEARMRAGNVRGHRSEHQRHGPPGAPHLASHGGGILVSDVLDAHLVRVLAPRLQLYCQAPVPQPSRASAENAEYGAVGLEDIPDLPEHGVDHRLEVVRALNGTVDSVQRLEEPKMRPVLLLGALALGDVPADAAIPDEASRLIEHRDAGNGVPDPAAVRGLYWALEVAEWQVRVDRRPVLAPNLFVGIDVGMLPARLADLGSGERRRVARPLG
jgi:hypothetical protein